MVISDKDTKAKIIEDISNLDLFKMTQHIGGELEVDFSDLKSKKKDELIEIRNSIIDKLIERLKSDSLKGENPLFSDIYKQYTSDKNRIMLRVREEKMKAYNDIEYVLKGWIGEDYMYNIQNDSITIHFPDFGNDTRYDIILKASKDSLEVISRDNNIEHILVNKNDDSSDMLKTMRRFSILNKIYVDIQKSKSNINFIISNLYTLSTIDGDYLSQRDTLDQSYQSIIDERITKIFSEI